MSLGVAIKGPEGVVLAADSRVTLAAQHGAEPPMLVNFDNATKLLTFNKPNTYVAAVTYGVAVIGQRTAHSYLPEFELTLPPGKRLSIKKFSEELSKFFIARWKEDMPKAYKGPGMTFLVGGYDEKSVQGYKVNEAYGKVFIIDIPESPKPQPRNPDDFGMTWGGQLQIASRLIHGYDPILLSILKDRLNLNSKQIKKLTEVFKQHIEFTIPYRVLPLQDCVNLAIFLIRTTITGQQLAIGVRGVGGMIEVATITRTDGVSVIQKKEIHGE